MCKKILLYLHNTVCECWLYNLRGHQQLCKEEVLGLYGGSHIPLRVTEDSATGSSPHRSSQMVQFLDLFSIPEATLFANVMEVWTR